MPLHLFLRAPRIAAALWFMFGTGVLCVASGLPLGAYVICKIVGIGLVLCAVECSSRPLKHTRPPMSTSYYATCGRARFPVTSWEQVSRAYVRACEQLGLGASKAPRCFILKADGTVVAHVSFNGMIWPGAHYTLGDKPIHWPQRAAA